MRQPRFLPFMAGAPTFNVGLKPIALDHWLLPDSEAHILDWRRDRLDDLATCYRSQPEHQASEHEAARLVLDAIQKPRSRGALLPEACAYISDDLVVLNSIKDVWTVTSLLMTSPTFFSVDHAWGQGLSALHGTVPDGDRLSQRIARVFDHIQPDQILERFNWTLQAGDNRDTPDGTPMRDRAQLAKPDEAERLLHLRVERQTIRRLPETGGILFTIRVAIDPVMAIPEEARPMLAEAWQTIQPDGAAYKKWPLLAHLTEALFQHWDA